MCIRDSAASASASARNDKIPDLTSAASLCARRRRLENIMVTRPNTHEEQMKTIVHAAALFGDKEQGPFRVMIIDSLIALFRVEFQGRGELSERQQRMCKHMQDITRLIEEFNVACLITNQCQAVVDGMALGPSVKGVGGHILSHYSTTIMNFKKHKDNMRAAKLVDSPYLPESDAQFQLDERGISDTA